MPIRVRTKTETPKTPRAGCRPPCDAECVHQSGCTSSTCHDYSHPHERHRRTCNIETSDWRPIDSSQPHQGDQDLDAAISGIDTARNRRMQVRMLYEQSHIQPGRPKQESRAGLAKPEEGRTSRIALQSSARSPFFSRGPFTSPTATLTKGWFACRRSSIHAASDTWRYLDELQADCICV